MNILFNRVRQLSQYNIMLNFLYEFAISYPSPSNLTYFWNFGFLALIFLIFQILTGLFLSMHYVPNALLAFNSVEHIMRDVSFGALFRYMHANGASMFFIVVYLHILKGLYYGSYLPPRQWVWFFGVIILLIMILTAFFGYILPWGQMSFWAATVITNLCSSIPVVGKSIVYWIWGGYSVDNPTLNRFYTFHFLFPIILLALVGLHLISLHNVGSNNPLGISIKQDSFPFTGFFFVKDTVFYIIFFQVAIIFIFFYPTVLAHPDNWVMANPLVTPKHIVPEWYFLIFYAILRAIPDKLLGTITLVFSIVSLLILPFHQRKHIRTYHRLGWLSTLFFFGFIITCLLLAWVGAKPVVTPFIEIARVCTIYYFLYLLVITRGLWFFEALMNKNDLWDFNYSWSTYIYKNYNSFNSYTKNVCAKIFNFIIDFFIIYLGSYFGLLNNNAFKKIIKFLKEYNKF